MALTIIASLSPSLSFATAAVGYVPYTNIEHSNGICNFILLLSCIVVLLFLFSFFVVFFLGGP